MRTRNATASCSPKASPTRTRSPTCRCWRWSARRSPSTRTRVCRRWRGSEAGGSNGGAWRLATCGCRCPIRAPPDTGGPPAEESFTSPLSGEGGAQPRGGVPGLGCLVRGVDPPCRRCAEGRPGLCYNVTEGPIEVGLQTGYCADTGGGWGEVIVAHPSQIHPVPDALSDEAAVLIEPFACCVHAALRGGASKDDVVVVSGAGTIGLLTVAAIKLFTPPKRLIAIAKHPTQADLARKLGADQVIKPAEVYQRIRFATAGRKLEGMNRPLLLRRA